jgi:hypothetical protein
LPQPEQIEKLHLAEPLFKMRSFAAAANIRAVLL